jgi:hypothetical protein
MGISERAQRSIERIQEDERLRGDLDDTAASALVAWASALAEQIANDAARSDTDVASAIQAIRSAAHAASRTGENEPQQVIATAESFYHAQSGGGVVANVPEPASPALMQVLPNTQVPPPTEPSLIEPVTLIQPIESPNQPEPNEPTDQPPAGGLIQTLLQRLQHSEQQST